MKNTTHPKRSSKSNSATREVTPPEDATVMIETEETAGFEGSYRAFEAEALNVSREEAPTYTGNALVAFHNVRKGVSAILAARSQVTDDPEAPKVDFERVARSVRVAEAMVYAARQASRALASQSDRKTRIAAVYEMRDVLLTNAEAAVKAKVLVGDEARKVARIRSSNGPIRAAQDCLDLAAIFHHNAATLHGKTFVTHEMLERARTLGSELLHQLLPAGVGPMPAAPDAVEEAAQMRDRMAVVLARHHAYLAKIGGWLWGLDAAEHVPPLRSRKLAGESARRESAPAPAPQPT